MFDYFDKGQFFTMAKDPAFLFYSSDFLSGIADLTMDERGQYITLLCLQHQKGHLTEKMIRLCCGNAAADVLAKFKKDENGLYFNERLDIEIKKRESHGEKQRQRAIDGWKKRKESNIEEIKQSHGKAAAMPLEDENENEDINENRNRIENKKFDFKRALIDFGIPENVATDWMSVRKQKRAANTETAFESIKKEIIKSGLTPEHCITEAVSRSWQGFKSEWLTNNTQTNGKQQITFESKQDAIARKLAEEQRQIAERLAIAFGKNNT